MVPQWEQLLSLPGNQGGMASTSGSLDEHRQEHAQVVADLDDSLLVIEENVTRQAAMDYKAMASTLRGTKNRRAFPHGSLPVKVCSWRWTLG